MNYILGTFEGTLKWGFTFTFPILILAYVTKKAFRPFIKQWLQVCYALAFVYCIDIFIAHLVNIITAFSLIPKQFEGYDFYYSRLNQLSTYLYPAYILIIITLFIFRKVRTSFIWGFMVLLALHYEAIDIAYYMYTSLYKDYLPSSFSVTYNPLFGINPYVLCFIIFNLLATVIYFARYFWLKTKQTTI